jgi:hypothetical protein
MYNDQWDLGWCCKFTHKGWRFGNGEWGMGNGFVIPSETRNLDLEES